MRKLTDDDDIGKLLLDRERELRFKREAEQKAALIKAKTEAERRRLDYIRKTNAFKEARIQQALEEGRRYERALTIERLKLEAEAYDSIIAGQDILNDITGGNDGTVPSGTARSPQGETETVQGSGTGISETPDGDL